MAEKWNVKVYDEFDSCVYDYREEEGDDDLFESEDEAYEHGLEIIGAMRLGYEINSDFQDEDNSEYYIETEKV